MQRVILALAAVLLVLISIPGPSWAAEKKDHVCFRVLDADHDGLVTFAEFETVYGNDPATFEAADQDRSGTLTHEEYHRMLGHGAS